MTRKTPLFLPCLLAALWGSPAHANHPAATIQPMQTGPIRTISPIIQPVGKWSAGLSVERMDPDNLSDGRLAGLAGAGIEHVHSMHSVTLTTLGVAYGASDNFSIYVNLPYVNRDDIREGHFDPPDAEAEHLGNSNGLGDAVVLGKLLVVDEAYSQVSILAGIKLPTGEADEQNSEHETFDAEFQPGSGSWDPMWGFSAAHYFGRSSLTASALYTLVTKGTQDTDLGDRLNYGLAYAWRLRGAESHESGACSCLGFETTDLVLELNGAWVGQEVEDGEDDHNSGSHTVYLSPGVSVSKSGWNGAISLGVPVAHHLRGHQDDPGMRFLFSINKNF